MDLAVVVIHGIGSSGPGYADGFRAAVSDRLGADAARVAWAPVLWSDVLGPRQAAYLERARTQARLDWLKLRGFVVEGLGDAAAYSFVDQPTGTYVAVHDRIRRRVRELWTGELNRTPVPMVVLAHSLGSHVISSYIWDTQKGKPTGADPASSPFERMEWLAGMITFGSTIPLFTFAYDPVTPIAFPGAALPAAVRNRARWLNYYDADDVLGYPLKPLSPEYDAVVDADVVIDVGGLGISMTPLSHGEYWEDRGFVRPVAEYLAGLL
ncbi:MAG TPA: hypothetical protein VM367_18845 [Pseudonocardia sp.]|jgi:hypothetical protein|nr:hypothetical protein [Pseudonocardia sp.]